MKHNRTNFNLTFLVVIKRGRCRQQDYHIRHKTPEKIWGLNNQMLNLRQLYFNHKIIFTEIIFPRQINKQDKLDIRGYHGLRDNLNR